MTSDLHQQLLDVIDAQDGGFAWRTIRAVVEMHPPYLTADGTPYACSSCGVIAGWPCATIETVARELGVEVA